MPYCDSPAQTWDHVFGTVKDSRFSGHGHRLGNLLPCCKSCNSAKGNKDWARFLSELQISPSVRQERTKRIAAYLEKCAYQVAEPPEESLEYQNLLRIKAQVIDLLSKADTLVEVIRKKAKAP